MAGVLSPAVVATGRLYLSGNLNINHPRPAVAGSVYVPPQGVYSGLARSTGYQSTPVKQTAGTAAVTPHDGWYYRIHLIPYFVSLGNISGESRVTVYLWNAFFTTVNVQSLAISDPSITYSSASPVPGTMGPLALASYTLSVPASGSAVVDATFTWTINGVQYVLPITGRRVVVLPFLPDWQSGVTETLRYRTSLTTAFNGEEQTRILRQKPRRSYDVGYRLFGRAAATFDVLNFGWTGRMFAHPVWNEAGMLTADVPAGGTVLPVQTRYMGLRVGGDLILYRAWDDYRLVQVDAFDDTTITIASQLLTGWPKGARVFPVLISAADATVGMSRATDTHLDVSLSFTASPTEAIVNLPVEAAPATYRGFELYTKETNWREAQGGSSEAREIRKDNGVGPLLVTPKTDFPLRTRPHSWLAQNREELRTLRAFLARRNGRDTPVWMPTGTVDLELAESVLLGQSAVRFKSVPYASMIGQHPAMRNVLFVFRDGRREARRIVSSVDDQGLTVLGLDSGFNTVVAPGDLKRVSYLGLYRLGADDVTINHVTETISEITVNLVLKVPA